MKLFSKFKKNNLYSLILISLFLLLTSNIASVALAQGLVPCSGLDCTLCDLLELVKNLITFALEIGIAFAGLFIAWGAFVIMTAGDSEEKVSEGKKIMTTVVWGLVIAFSSWLILGTIIQVVTGSPSALPWNEIKCTF